MDATTLIVTISEKKPENNASTASNAPPSLHKRHAHAFNFFAGDLPQLVEGEEGRKDCCHSEEPTGSDKLGLLVKSKPSSQRRPHCNYMYSVCEISRIFDAHLFWMVTLVRNALALINNRIFSAMKINFAVMYEQRLEQLTCIPVGQTKAI